MVWSHNLSWASVEILPLEYTFYSDFVTVNVLSRSFKIKRGALNSLPNDVWLITNKGIFFKIRSKIANIFFSFSLVFLSFNCEYLNLTKMYFSVFAKKLFICMTLCTHPKYQYNPQLWKTNTPGTVAWKFLPEKIQVKLKTQVSFTIAIDFNERKTKHHETEHQVKTTQVFLLGIFFDRFFKNRTEVCILCNTWDSTAL